MDMAAPRPNKLGSHGRERALVVESDRREADRSVEVLRDMGYAVHVARDGREALSTLSRAPKLVLINATPEGGGVADFVTRLRRLRGMEAVPVVATHSGEPPSSTVRSSLMDAGVGAFLPRPFAPADVMGALSAATGTSALPEFRPVTHRELSAVEEADLPRARVSSLPSSGGLPSFNPVSSPSLTGISSAPSSSTISAVGEVPATLLSADGELDCVVLSANQKRIIVKLAAIVGPEVDEQVRLHIHLRDVVADAMQDLPVRVLGTILASQSVGAALKLTLNVEIANPESHLQHLNRYLLRFG